MDKYTYSCKYCGGSYIPKRRHKQKYCSSSCRVGAFKKRKALRQNLPEAPKNADSRTVENMSLSGIGNAAVGTLATNLVTNIFTKEENKPATKGDIQKLLGYGIRQSVLIKNLPVRSDGSRAYFDAVKQILIYKK
ncbi:hypothetical protein F6U93_09975 [Tamlana haliotis]|uniref:Uncharacterized protein n=1 Tax=Pseudotamlana haliotis TaxID=2614804 RepID=A0A6N6ME66_9FLAO|nr:hypothetical protein [Tamlana haliotis]KAB1067603.1 hypothetical protein F6U93_09975 [Tamlana haliotis]